MKVQELIHMSIRTLSNSISNRSPEPDVAAAHRDASNELVPVPENELEAELELEQKWYTLEEQAQEEMMHRDGEETKGEAPASSSNPFRMLHKKEKDSAVRSNNLDVKRVKYQYKQTSPGDKQLLLEEEKKEIRSAAA